MLKTHCFRLHRGDDLRRSLEDYAREHHIRAATVLSAVGCLTRARVRDASGVTVQELEEELEIVSLMGTLSEARTHLHISLARRDLTTVGGHLKDGCIVNTTAEIVLLELPGVAFRGAPDPETGYEELVISQLEEEI